MFWEPKIETMPVEDLHRMHTSMLKTWCTDCIPSHEFTTGGWKDAGVAHRTTSGCSLT